MTHSFSTVSFPVNLTNYELVSIQFNVNSTNYFKVVLDGTKMFATPATALQEFSKCENDNFLGTVCSKPVFQRQVGPADPLHSDAAPASRSVAV